MCFPHAGTKEWLWGKHTFHIHRFCSWKKPSVSALVSSSLSFSCLQAGAVPGCPHLQGCWCEHFPSISFSSPLALALLSTRSIFLLQQGGELGQAGPSLAPGTMLSILCPLQGQGEPPRPAVLAAGSAHHPGQC